MRHSLEYKNPSRRTTIGFIEFNRERYSLDLRIIKNCSRYRPLIKKMYKEILDILGKHYVLIDTNYTTKKINNLQNSRFRKTKLGKKCQRKK